MNKNEDESINAVAARLKQVREILALSRKDFGGAAGLTEQVYGPFELGKRMITLDAAKKLRKTYGLSLEFIYFGNIDDLPHRIAKEL